MFSFPVPSNYWPTCVESPVLKTLYSSDSARKYREDPSFKHFLKNRKAAAKKKKTLSDAARQRTRLSLFLLVESSLKT
jgi:anaerobic C4-dicarboxylate transporter